jgi:hypothetical protein
MEMRKRRAEVGEARWVVTGIGVEEAEIVGTTL